MKKYIPILFLIFLFACEDDFYKEVNKYLLVETDAEKNDLVNGIYSRLIAVHNSNYFKLFSRSDDINLYSSYTFFSDGKVQCSATGSGAIDYVGIADGIYQNLYVAVININSLLQKLTIEEDKTLIGELYFLRAYSYFKLARFFGTPPLVVDVDVDYTLDKPSYAEVYQLIERDLLKAIELLPDTYTEARVPNETPHKGTAKALLAEVYLTMAGYPLNDTAKYAEAARLSGEVIEKADYYNFSLLPDLASLWKEENRHNSENVFGLFFGESSDEEVNLSGSSYLGNYISGSYHPELKFYDNFPNNYRREVSLVEGYYTSLDYETEDTSFSILKYYWYDPVKDPCSFVSGCIYKKWIDQARWSDNTYSSRWPKITLYLLRYAQTLLTYAEAKARSGDLDASAFEMVNQVRRRANHLDLFTPSKYDLSPALTTEQFLDSVVWERAWELAFEPDGRWFDLIRLDMRGKLKNLQFDKDFPNSVSSYYLTEDWYFYKIPEDDRWLNPNFK